METTTAAQKKRPRGRPPKNGNKTSIYVSNDATALWEAVAAKMGVNKTSVLEMALRDFAASKGVGIKSDESS